MSSSSSSSGGMGALGFLGVIFVCAKVFGIAPVASWSWWWVTAPFWGGLAVLLAIVLSGLGITGLAYVIACAADAFSRRSKRPRKRRGLR